MRTETTRTIRGITIPESRECPQCEEDFKTADSRKVYCDHKCRKDAEKANRREHTFIGVDGEGFGRGEAHTYALLGCGSRQIEDSSGLTWEAALDFLYNCFLENRNAIYVGFFLRYDFSHILRTMPEERVRMLLSNDGIRARRRTASGGNPVPFPVDLSGNRKWEIDTLALKRIKFRPKYGHKGWMYICDAGPFFQCSLLKAIDPREWDEPIVTQEEYDLIKKGKEDRDHASLDDDTRMYNRLENDVLSRLMKRVDQGLTDAKVRLSKENFYGPGAAAAKWMDLTGQPTGEEVQDCTPQEVWDAAVASYYGGWFEIMAHGHVQGSVYEYDINSAYPYIMENLPCLLHGEWIHGYGEFPSDNNVCLVRTEVRGSNRYIGTMLHRNCNGGIMRPHVTKGVFWAHELRAAERAGLIDSYGHQTEWWAYKACNCPRPLASLRGLYDQRLRVGKNTPYGKALKLIYNSIYGKAAQSVGLAKYANPIYASLITAGCRTQILNAIATHPNGPEACVMVATDGVYFLDEHPHLKLGAALGDWEMAVKHGLTLFKPGVYWDDKLRQQIQREEEVKLKSRGVNGKVFSKYIGDLDAAFARWTDVATEWPEVTMQIPFSFVSPSQALQRNDWDQCGRIVEGRPNLQKSIPTKRRQTARRTGRVYRSGVKKVAGFCKCPKKLSPTESHPYEKRFGEREWEDLQEYTRDSTGIIEMGLCPDGT